MKSLKFFTYTLILSLSLHAASEERSTPYSQKIAETCEAVENEISKLQSLLGHQKNLISKLEPTTFQTDLARLLFLKQALVNIDSNIRANSLAGRSLVTPRTLTLIQHLLIKYQHSATFFGWEEVPSYLSIHTDRTASLLMALRTSYAETVSIFGFDEIETSQITASTFKEIKMAMEKLAPLARNKELSDRLSLLGTKLGSTVTLAQLGDRPCTLIQAIEAVNSIRDIYPLLDEAASSAVGFELVMQIQGATEFYAEYAQADQISLQGICRTLGLKGKL